MNFKDNYDSYLLDWIRNGKEELRKGLLNTLKDQTYESFFLVYLFKRENISYVRDKINRALQVGKEKNRKELKIFLEDLLLNRYNGLTEMYNLIKK